MAIDWAEATEELLLLVKQAETGRGWRQSDADAVRTRRQDFTTQVGESTGYKDVQSRNLQRRGDGVFGALEDAVTSHMDGITLLALAEWAQLVRRRINDSTGATFIHGVDVDSILKGVYVNMLADSQTVDGSAVSLGSVAYGTSNQGDGTITMALHGSANYKQLALNGNYVLTCIAGGFSLQGSEPWQLGFQSAGAAARRIGQTRVSPTRIITGVEAEDVVYDADLLQVPQRGNSMHSGLIITVGEPDYTALVDSGDTDAAFASYNVQTKVAGKTNLTKRNTTYVYHSSNPNGTIYLDVVKDGANFHCTFYKEIGLTTALTETKTFTVASGDGVKTFKTATTNPEHVSKAGGFLTTDDTFIEVNVTCSLLVTDVTISITANLPWAAGDTAQVLSTNDYAGTVLRFFVEELGLMLPSKTDGSETISDP